MYLLIVCLSDIFPVIDKVGTSEGGSDLEWEYEEVGFTTEQI